MERGVVLCVGWREESERAITEGPAFHQQLIRALRWPQEDFQRWTNEAVCPQTSGCRPRRVITQATVRE